MVVLHRQAIGLTVVTALFCGLQSHFLLSKFMDFGFSG